MNKNITSFLFIFLKKRSKFLLPTFIVLASFLYSQTVISADSDRKIGEILYKLKNNQEIYTMKVKEEVFEEKLNDLNSRDDIEYAEPNFLYKTALIPSDYYYENQWYLKKIKAVEAWDSVRESPEIVIAIIDSGVQINHPDLKDSIWINIMEASNNKIDDDKNGYVDDVNGWDFVNNVADPSPKFDEGFTQNGIMHGTVVAGAAAASGNNASGISGVSWRTKIMPLKVLADNGEGEVKNVIRAIDYAIDNGADIINFSFVGFNYSKSMDNAIRRAYEAGIIVVAAAGNEQGEGYGYSLDATPIYPACNDGGPGENMVIGVAATDTLDQKASFSSYGFKCVDISAPGVSIFSTAVYSPEHKIDDEYFNKYYDGYWSGTSMATPLISGALALIQKANPLLNHDEVIDVLINSTDNINRLNPLYLGQLGSGRLNIEKAVANAQAKLSSSETKLIFSPYTNMRPIVTISDEAGNARTEFMAYSENFYGGVRIATGDVNGDGVNEIVTSAGFSGGPHIRVFSASGELISQFFAYDKDFRGGVNVAVGDLNNDGIAEIVVAPGIGSEPMVRVFDYKGNKRRQFMAYQKNLRNGVTVAVGDVNGDGYDEIVTGVGFGGGPQVLIFDRQGILEGQFFAFDKNLRKGVNVAILNINNGSRREKAKIVTSIGSGYEPIIRVYNNHAQVENQFLAYQKEFTGGVNISAGDFDKNGIDEVITGAAGNGAPHVRIFNKKGELLNSFYGYEKNYLGGVSISAISINK